MKLKDIIKIYLQEHDISVRQLSRQSGLSNTYISNIVNGDDVNPSLDALKKISRGLGISSQELFDMLDNEQYIEINSMYNYDNIFPIEKKKFPLLGTVACGEPIYADEDRESYIMAGTDINADFCLKCKGDSMINARIYDGDIVFIKEQSIVNNGEIAVVIIGDEATLKRVYYYREQNFLLLKAENPKFKDLEYRGEEIDTIRILGKAVAFQSDVI